MKYILFSKFNIYNQTKQQNIEKATIKIATYTHTHTHTQTLTHNIYIYLKTYIKALTILKF